MSNALATFIIMPILVYAGLGFASATFVWASAQTTPPVAALLAVRRRRDGCGEAPRTARLNHLNKKAGASRIAP